MHRMTAFLLVTALVVVACGSSTASPSQAPSQTPVVTPTPEPSPTLAPTADLLGDSIEATIAEGTVSVDMLVVFEGSSMIPSGTSMRIDGQMALSRPLRADLTSDFSGLGMGRFEMIVDAGVLWFRFEGLFDEFVPPGMWVRVDDSMSSALAVGMRGAMSGSSDPSVSLYYLYGATSAPERLGTGLVHGVAVTKYRVPVDLDLALATLPSGPIRDSLLVNIEDIKKQGVATKLETEVWIGDDGLIDAQVLVYALSSLQGGGTMTGEIEYFDHGAPLDIRSPNPDEVVDADDVVMPTPAPS